jgi:hypothetical protein
MNLRMFNQGVCRAYGDYKEHRFSNVRLLIRSLREFMAFGAKIIEAELEKILGFDRWHWSRAWASYWLSRSKYDRELIFNEELRRLVLKDNWFEE